MFKPESWQSHNEYRTIVNTFGRRLSRNNPKYFFDLFDRERQKLLNLNLDPVLAGPARSLFQTLPPPGRQKRQKA